MTYRRFKGTTSLKSGCCSKPKRKSIAEQIRQHKHACEQLRKQSAVVLNDREPASASPAIKERLSMKPETIESPESRASAATACWATARVVVIESERGWGQKVVERKEFPNMDAAMLFVREFNAEHCPPRDEVPEWYMQARVVD